MSRNTCAIGAVLVTLCAGVADASGAPAGASAPVNPYRGMQDREETFAFAQKPSVKKDGSTWIITFTTTAACDATVTIVTPDGTIVRRLASGVLGKNAPWPFRQDALSQEILWDGTDDLGRQAPAGCRARVSLGLRAAFERNIGYDPYGFSKTRPATPLRKLYTAVDKDGSTWLLQEFRSTMFGRVFDRDGNYLRTFYPPPAAELEKWKDFIHTPGSKDDPLAVTEWGDKVPNADRYGPWCKQSSGEKSALKVISAFSGVPEPEIAKDVTPAFLSRATLKPIEVARLGSLFPMEASLGTKYCRMCVDRYREELYVGGDRRPFFRFDGTTGEIDASWFPRGDMNKIAECHVGPDGLLYLRIGCLGYGQWIMRMDHEGTPVPFKKCTTPLWHTNGDEPSVLKKGVKISSSSPMPSALRKAEIPVLWTGLVGHSNIHDRGLYVAPNGTIVAAVSHINSDFAAKHGDFEGVTAQDSNNGMQYRGTYVQVWTSDGELLTTNAVGTTINGHGAAMDRDGSIYTAILARPEGRDRPDGITDRSGRGWGGMGSIIKFPGQGGTYPVGTTVHPAKQSDTVPPAPEGAIKLEKGWTTGATWMYPGLPAQSRSCTCHNIRWDMDYWARTFIPANHLSSVMVLDANGNRIARFGRYGNVDDTDADMKEGRDSLRFSWIRALCVSDRAFYAADVDNYRILKAVLSYHAEEEVALGGER